MDNDAASMDKQQKQSIFDLPKVIAVGIASPIATILTSRFGITGTLIGLALSAVLLTALVDILKVYLARAPATVAKVPTTVARMPGGLRAGLSWRHIRSRFRAAFTRISSLPPARRRALLIGGVIAAGISFFVGLSAITALEVGVGKSLSCWVWDDCPTESSTDSSKTRTTSTLPSILGGGRSGGGGDSKVQPPSSQQPSPSAPAVPSQPEGVRGSEQPSSLQPGQRWNPSAAPEEGEAQHPSSSEGLEEGAQHPGSSEGSEEGEQQIPASGSELDQQPEDQRSQSSDPDQDPDQ